MKPEEVENFLAEMKNDDFARTMAEVHSRRTEVSRSAMAAGAALYQRSKDRGGLDIRPAY